MFSDFKIAFRQLTKSPRFTVIAVLTLALGIGLNTAMFSFVNAVLLRPLPFPDSEKIVRLFRKTAENQYGNFSPADYSELKREEKQFGHFAGYQWSGPNLEGSERTPPWMRASANLFEVLGVKPEIGRIFRPENELKGDDHVVLISHRLWQDRFGGSAEIIGHTVRANGETYEIIGVLPSAINDHRLFGGVGLVSPLILESNARLNPKDASPLNILGRRESTVSEAQANAFITAFAARLALEHPAENAGCTWWSEGLPTVTTGPTGKMMLGLLLGLAGCVLLIACSNLANFFLARTVERTREFAVRSAMGASRLKLIRPLALESLMHATAGGVGAILVAVWTTDWMRSLLETGGMPIEFALDWRVLSFGLVTSVITLFFSSITPAFWVLRINANEALKNGGRGVTVGRSHQRFRHALVTGQFAFAFVLLAGAGFFLQGSLNLMKQHFGWEVSSVLQGEIALSGPAYPDARAISAFHQRAIERMQQLPGVESVSFSARLPYLGLFDAPPFVVDGSKDFSAGIPFQMNTISPAYFKTTGTRLIAGRTFTDADTAVSPRVAIINETTARMLFPNGSPLGHRIKQTYPENAAWLEIVGVVADVISVDVARPNTTSQLYQPTTQDSRPNGFLALRTSGVSPATLIPAVRAAIAEIDSAVNVQDLMPAEQAMKRTTSQMVLCTRLLTGCALLGLFLSVLGIYGSMANLVIQRTNEIGIRMALGAQMQNVLGLFLNLGLRIAIISAGIGLSGALGLSQLLRSFLPGMDSSSHTVIAIATVLVVAVALLASWLPARRATKVDPMVALRAE